MTREQGWFHIIHIFTMLQECSTLAYWKLTWAHTTLILVFRHNLLGRSVGGRINWQTLQRTRLRLSIVQCRCLDCLTKPSFFLFFLSNVLFVKVSIRWTKSVQAEAHSWLYLPFIRHSQIRQFAVLLICAYRNEVKNGSNTKYSRVFCPC